MLIDATRSLSTDLEVRWCLLKLCEVLIKPSEEPLPKIKLKMASNVLRLSSNTVPASSELPVSSTIAPAIPKIKLGGGDAGRREASVEAHANVTQPLKLVLGNKKGQPKVLKEQKS